MRCSVPVLKRDFSSGRISSATERQVKDLNFIRTRADAALLRGVEELHRNRSETHRADGYLYFGRSSGAIPSSRSREESLLDSATEIAARKRAFRNHPRPKTIMPRKLRWRFPAAFVKSSPARRFPSSWTTDTPS